MRRDGAVVLSSVPKRMLAPPITDPPAAWMRALTFAEIVTLPDGKYRFYLSRLRRARRGNLAKKLPSRRIVLSAADKRWAEAIKARDVGCRGIQVLSHDLPRDAEEAAHVIPRRYKRTRWLPENGLGLCRSCHRWLHDHPHEAKTFFIGQIGQAQYDRLWQIARGDPA